MDWYTCRTGTPASTYCSTKAKAVRRHQGTDGLRRGLKLAGLLIGRHPSHPLTNHQRMDVIGALVRLHGFQVAEVAHDGVLVHDTVGPQQVARQPRAIERH